MDAMIQADGIAMDALTRIALYVRDHHDPLWEEHARAIGTILEPVVTKRQTILHSVQKEIQ